MVKLHLWKGERGRSCSVKSGSVRSFCISTGRESKDLECVAVESSFHSGSRRTIPVARDCIHNDAAVQKVPDEQRLAFFFGVVGKESILEISVGCGRIQNREAYRNHGNNDMTRDDCTCCNIVVKNKSNLSCSLYL
jgi:hypothetical protein